MAVAETREGQLLCIVDAAAVTAHHVVKGRGHIVFAKHQSAIDHRLQVGAACQRQRHAPAGGHLAEAGMAFPLGKIIGVVGIAGLGAHASAGEVPVILGVVLQAGMVIEIVLVLLELADAVGTVQDIIVVVMLPGNAQVDIEVEGVEREQCGIGLLIDELQVFGAVLPLIQVDVLMPDFIGQADAAVRLGNHVPGQAPHGALAQSERKVQGLVEFVAEVVGAANLCRHQFLVVIPQAYAHLDGVLGIFLIDEFMGCGVVDVVQADDAVVGPVVIGYAGHPLENHDGIHLGPCGFFAPLNQFLDGRAVEVGGRVAPDGHTDDEVAILVVLVAAVVDVGAHRAFQNVAGGVVLVVQPQVGPDTDDDVGAHLAGQVGRKVVLGAAVNQDIGVHPHGSEDAGHSHAGADRLGQRAVVEHHLAVGH